MNKRDLDALYDIVSAAELALEFLDGVSEEAFLDDKKTQAAVIRQLEIVGEAASRVSSATRMAHPEISWREVVGMRNKLIHRYDDVEIGLVWDTCQDSLLELLRSIRALIDAAEKN